MTATQMCGTRDTLAVRVGNVQCIAFEHIPLRLSQS